MDKNKVISRYHLTLELISSLELKNSPIILKKGESFIKYGKPANKIGILINGLLYATYISEAGTEWISRFFFPPNNFIVSNHRGFNTGKNSSESILFFTIIRAIYSIIFLSLYEINLPGCLPRR